MSNINALKMILRHSNGNIYLRLIIFKISDRTIPGVGPSLTFVAKILFSKILEYCNEIS